MTTLQQIEKQFGEGSIMPLGADGRRRVQGHLDRQLVARPGPGRSGNSARPDHRDLSARNPAAKRPWRCTSSPKPRRTAASRRSSTPSMPSIPAGPRSWASSWTRCWSASPVAAKRRCRSREMLIKSNAVDVIIVDSVAALVPQTGAGRRNRRLARRFAGPPDESIDAEADRCHRQEQDRWSSSSIRFAKRSA